MGHYAKVAMLNASEVKAGPDLEATVLSAYAPLLDRYAAVGEHVLLVAGKPAEWPRLGSADRHPLGPVVCRPDSDCD
jgi:hypothetical protein